jgi:beta-phosphoglucomutase-like phosphatase (HAD superfamily)
LDESILNGAIDLVFDVPYHLHHIDKGKEMNVVVFDLDGTLADCSHRLHYIKGETKDWAGFYASVKYDAPIPEMVKLCKSLHVLNKIVICTGRSDVCRDDTLDWLSDHGLTCDALYMRKANDRRPDYVVKLDLLRLMRRSGFDPYMVFEDRSQVVKMWRDAGIRCLQVCDGEY